MRAALSRSPTPVRDFGQAVEDVGKATYKIGAKA